MCTNPFGVNVTLLRAKRSRQCLRVRSVFLKLSSRYYNTFWIYANSAGCSAIKWPQTYSTQ